MTRIEYIKTIAAFAREYVNSADARTAERNALIVDAAKVLLNKTLSTCVTCYIETVMEISRMSTENTSYQLRAGALLEIFSRADLNMVNGNLTDDLAELHLGVNPSSIKYFEKYPVETEGAEFAGISDERLHELKIKFDYPKGYAEANQDGEEDNLPEDDDSDEDAEANQDGEKPKNKRGRKPANI